MVCILHSCVINIVNGNAFLCGESRMVPSNLNGDKRIQIYISAQSYGNWPYRKNLNIKDGKHGTWTKHKLSYIYLSLFVSQLPSVLYTFCKLLLIILISTLCFALHQKKWWGPVTRTENEIWTKSQLVTVALK